MCGECAIVHTNYRPLEKIEELHKKLNKYQGYL